ncbi:hypothetical protein TIFTF001_041246 [Ficus carica]|uniref:Uncharacterized protein n=1 Tax=Ficus carica TaxID=3494 RepID=A0AA87Z4Z9_FICCA|nr:hypothetical protein TIFTF001_041239 [Ficus carica]GMN28908.1 hypothetical protein TIFTF001_041246 [Ficus carica]
MQPSEKASPLPEKKTNLVTSTADDLMAVGCCCRLSLTELRRGCEIVIVTGDLSTKIRSYRVHDFKVIPTVARSESARIHWDFMGQRISIDDDV